MCRGWEACHQRGAWVALFHLKRPTVSYWKAELEIQQAGFPFILRRKMANRATHSNLWLHLIQQTELGAHCTGSHWDDLELESWKLCDWLAWLLNHHLVACQKCNSPDRSLQYCSLSKEISLKLKWCNYIFQKYNFTYTFSFHYIWLPIPPVKRCHSQNVQHPFMVSEDAIYHSCNWIPCRLHSRSQRWIVFVTYQALFEGSLNVFTWKDWKDVENKMTSVIAKLNKSCRKLTLKGTSVKCEYCFNNPCFTISRRMDCSKICSLILITSIIH